MSMPKNQAKEPIVYVRRRKKKETTEIVANDVACSDQQLHGRNIDYVGSQLDFSKDLGETAQRLEQTKVWESNTFDADKKENNYIMNSADYCAQRGNKGITICERSLDSRSDEMAKFLGTSNDHSSGQKLQLQNMNQVTPNYLLSNGMKEMSVRPNHMARITVHPSRIIGPSRFSPNYDQNMQRTSVSVPHNFSVMKLLMENENSSSLTDEELLYAKDLLSTDQGLTLEGNGVQQSPRSQVENHQNMQRTSESATTNFSYMKLLMEDEENSKLTNELCEKQFLNTSEGRMVQQWPYAQVENYQNVQRTPESATSNFSYMKLLMEDEESSTLTSDLYEKQLLGTQYSLSLEGQTVQQLPVSQVENYQFGDSSAGQMVQQWPCSQVGNSPFDNSVQQNCQNQVLTQSKEISFRELLVGDDISYMDLLTREDLLISWNCDA